MSFEHLVAVRDDRWGFTLAVYPSHPLQHWLQMGFSHTGCFIEETQVVSVPFCASNREGNNIQVSALLSQVQ